MTTSNASQPRKSAGEFRYQKVIGRVGALAVMLGVGAGLSATLSCGTALATPASNSSTSSETPGGHTSTGTPSGRASIHAGRQAPAQSNDESDAADSRTARRTHHRKDASDVATVGNKPARLHTIQLGHNSDTDRSEPTESQPESTTNDIASPLQTDGRSGTGGDDSTPVTPTQQLTGQATGSEADAQPATRTAPILLRAIIKNTLTRAASGSPAPQGLPDRPLLTVIAGLWRELRDPQHTSAESNTAVHASVVAVSATPSTGYMRLNGAMITGYDQLAGAYGARVFNFSSGGIVVGASPAAPSSWQYVTVVYQLQHVVNGTWTAMATSPATWGTVRGTQQIFLPGWTTGAYPAPYRRSETYRIVYSIGWADYATGRLLASIVLAPSAGETACSVRFGTNCQRYLNAIVMS